MAMWNATSVYPGNYDFPMGWVKQVDNVDIVWANHPNSLASSISALQAKLGLDNEPAVGIGGIQFSPAGHSTNPSPTPGFPAIWINTLIDPDGAPIYTDKFGRDYDLRNASNAAFIGYNYTCPSGIVEGDLVSISSNDTVVLADADNGLAADGMVINVPVPGGTTCDIAYRAEIEGLSGLVAGTTYYLGNGGLYVDEAGLIGLGLTSPAVKQEIGVARNASTMVFNPTLATEI